MKNIDKKKLEKLIDENLENITGGLNLNSVNKNKIKAGVLAALATTSSIVPTTSVNAASFDTTKSKVLLGVGAVAGVTTLTVTGAVIGGVIAYIVSKDKTICYPEEINKTQLTNTILSENKSKKSEREYSEEDRQRKKQCDAYYAAAIKLKDIYLDENLKQEEFTEKMKSIRDCLNDVPEQDNFSAKIKEIEDNFESKDKIKKAIEDIYRGMIQIGDNFSLLSYFNKHDVSTSDQQWRVIPLEFKNKIFKIMELCKIELTNQELLCYELLSNHDKSYMGNSGIMDYKESITLYEEDKKDKKNKKDKKIKMETDTETLKDKPNTIKYKNEYAKRMVKRENNDLPFYLTENSPDKIENYVFEKLTQHFGHIKPDEKTREKIKEVVDKVSSDLDPNHLTDAEKIFDGAVRAGMLPTENYSTEAINDTYKDAMKNFVDLKREKENVFIIKQGIDAIKLDSYASNNSIVQVASTFNAIEGDGTMAVKNYPQCHAQGQSASIQSIAASKYREAARNHPQQNSLYYMLSKCDINGSKIMEKYPELFKNGAFFPDKITDIDDMRHLRDFLKGPAINDLGILSQWVKCEVSDKVQLQVFSAAPNLSGSSILSDPTSERSKLLTEISELLCVAQYKAIAQMAAIKYMAEKRFLKRKTFEVHLTLLGQGVYKNPPSIITKCLQAVYDVLHDKRDVFVVLHAYTQQDAELWKKALSNIK